VHFLLFTINQVNTRNPTCRLPADIIEHLHHLEVMILLSLGLAFFLLFSATGMARRVTRSLYLLMGGVREIGKGHLEQKVTLTTHDEFGEAGKSDQHRWRRAFGKGADSK